MNDLRTNLLRWTLLVLPSASTSYTLSRRIPDFTSLAASVAIAIGVAIIIWLASATDLWMERAWQPRWRRHFMGVVALFAATQLATTIAMFSSVYHPWIEGLSSAACIPGMFAIGASSWVVPAYPVFMPLHACVVTTLVGSIWIVAAIVVSRMTLFVESLVVAVPEGGRP